MRSDISIFTQGFSKFSGFFFLNVSCKLLLLLLLSLSTCEKARVWACEGVTVTAFEVFGEDVDYVMFSPK